MNENITYKLQNFFKTQPVEKAWVFGSFSRGEESPESDVDILVKFDKSERVSLLRYCKMICDLETLTGRNIDLVEDGQLKPFAVDSANRDKILIYERTS
ncbi:MAG: nucleotidyltransferase domain-containing protein [Bacteroidales bacterium]|nr:nucleotidyltransferase domain-containing protein [Bacteroidales bacterium]